MAKPSNWEITHTKPEKTQPHREFEKPPESLAGLTVDYVFHTKPAHKDWERWMFFQMHKSPQKITKHRNKQGNMVYVAQIKGTN